MKKYTEKEMNALNDTVKTAKEIGIVIDKIEASILIDDGICPQARSYQDYLTILHIYQFLLKKEQHKDAQTVIQEAEFMNDDVFLEWVKQVI